MANTVRPTDLLLRWYQRRQHGEPVSAAEICADCPEMAEELQRAIDAVLSVEERFVLASTTTGSFEGANAVSTSPDRKTTPSVGKGEPHQPSIHGYELLEELGRGGMGIVYKAYQVGLKRTVALKMILAGDFSNNEQESRFRLEAEAVGMLQHPNIVQVFDTGEVDKRPYFSMEFVDGSNLAKKLAGTPMRPQDAALLLETLARAMHVAHEKGIVHRDLKPANILLTRDGIPKITDFGLAKNLQEKSERTASGAVMGTPSYTAPEQAEGRSRDIGPVTDVYALGAILYELLTGRPPFRAATTMETIMQVVQEEPISPRRLQRSTPRDLETICLKCLHKEPSKRYPERGNWRTNSADT